MVHKSAFVWLFLLIASQTTYCQSRFSGWLADFNTIKLNERFSVHSDFQLRSSDRIEHVQTLLLRGGLNVHINRKFIATAGYAYIHNRTMAGAITGYAAEHRLWQQLVFNHPLVIGSGTYARNGTLQHRLRVEQRFIPVPSVQNNALVKDGRDFASRIRYFFRNITPLVPWSPTGAAPFLALQNELFFNVGDKSAVNGSFFDQNRAYVALGYRFHKNMDVEAGYLNQYTKGAGDSFVNNHVVQLATYLRL